MINNTFFIVARENDQKPFELKPYGDKWGWELVDGIEMTDWQEAKRMLEEYRSIMPKHTVLIRAIEIRK